MPCLVTKASGALLPHLFTLAPYTRYGAVLSLWHFPEGHPSLDVIQHPTLCSPDFPPHAWCDHGMARPSKPLREASLICFYENDEWSDLWLFFFLGLTGLKNTQATIAARTKNRVSSTKASHHMLGPVHTNSAGVDSAIFSFLQGFASEVCLSRISLR